MTGPSTSPLHLPPWLHDTAPEMECEGQLTAARLEITRILDRLAEMQATLEAVLGRPLQAPFDDPFVPTIPGASNGTPW